MSVVEIAEIVVTDSILQIKNYHRPFFLKDSKHMLRIINLSQTIQHPPSKEEDRNAVTLFCSVGLSGTEVLLANSIL